VKQFAYLAANDCDSAVAAYTNNADQIAHYLGGGTNLVDLMKLGVETPTLLIDVSGLTGDGIDEITMTDDGEIRIGAAVRNSDLAAHPLIRRHFPAVSQAVLAGASGQLRNVATVGGNLMQRTRCSYFADITKPCNKRQPGSGCPARTGEHHNLAIIGGSLHCIATSPSDLAVAFAAFGAVVQIREADTERSVPIEEFRRLPGDHPEIEASAAPGALITGITLSRTPLAARSRYRKVRERASYAFAIASIAAAIEVTDGVVSDSRLAFGAIAPVPWRAHRAEQFLRGKPASRESFAAAADAELAPAEPLTDNAYKLALIRNLTVDVLSELTGANR
jgi:xanthine dehydrogenase YagS FAD-binding subunit